MPRHSAGDLRHCRREARLGSVGRFGMTAGVSRAGTHRRSAANTGGALLSDSERPDGDNGPEHRQAGNRPSRRVHRAICFRLVHHGIVPVGHTLPPGDRLWWLSRRHRLKVQRRFDNRHGSSRFPRSPRKLPSGIPSPGPRWASAAMRKRLDVDARDGFCYRRRYYREYRGRELTPRAALAQCLLRRCFSCLPSPRRQRVRLTARRRRSSHGSWSQSRSPAQWSASMAMR
jgi:hypothetical protein